MLQQRQVRNIVAHIGTVGDATSRAAASLFIARDLVRATMYNVRHAEFRHAFLDRTAIFGR